MRLAVWWSGCGVGWVGGGTGRHNGGRLAEVGIGFELAEVVTELGEGIVFGGESEGGEDGLMDLSGAPPAELGAAVEQHLHEAEHAGVLNLDAGDFGVS